MDDGPEGSNQDAGAEDIARRRSATSLTAIEEDVYQVRNRSGQDPLNFPIKLNNKIAALGSTVQHGDGKPTASSYEVYKLLHDRLLDEQAKLDHLLSSELPAVNKSLTDRKLAALVPTKIETPQPKAPAQ